MSRSVSATVASIWTVTLAGLAGFLAMALAVANALTDRFDRAVLLSLRDPDNLSDAWGPVWFEEAAAELTALGGYPILIVVSLLVITALLLIRKFAAALFLFLALSGGSLLSTALKLLFERQRPDLVDHLDRTFTSSFPSAHAMVSMVAWLTLAAVAIRFIPRHRLRIFVLVAAFMLAFVIGASRVYLGVHWPSDVVAGWCIGMSWAGACWLALHYASQAMLSENDLGESST